MTGLYNGKFTHLLQIFRGKALQIAMLDYKEGTHDITLQGRLVIIDRWSALNTITSFFEEGKGMGKPILLTLIARNKNASSCEDYIWIG